MVASILARARALLGLKPAEPELAAPVRKIEAHHAVSITTGPRGCAAARDLRDRRFLSRDAPALPLEGCDSPECSCRYEHHADRRKGARRARDMGVAVDGWVETDQREKSHRGRRKGDGPAQ